MISIEINKVKKRGKRKKLQGTIKIPKTPIEQKARAVGYLPPRTNLLGHFARVRVKTATTFY